MGIAVSPNGQYVYDVNYESNSVSVIDAVSNMVTATITVGSVPWGIAVSSNGQYAYVTNEGNYNGNSVSVINTTSNTVTATIPVGSTPRGIAVSSNSQYVYVTNCGSNTVSVLYADNTFAVSVTQGDYGTIAPGTTTVNYGGSQAFTFTPATDYHLVDVLVNGTSVFGSVVDGAYTVSTVTGATNLTASYAIDTFAVSVTQGLHGTIAPGTTTVNYGDSQEFTFTPDTGYYLTDVLMNGTSVLSSVTDDKYTVSDVTGATTLTASYAIDTFSITVTQGLHGTIAPGTTTVNYGDSQAFTFTPDTGYHLADVLVNGTSVFGSVVDGAYTVSDVTGDTSVNATFATNQDTITVTQTANGAISPSTSILNYANNQTFIITPNTGYSIASITVDGTPVTTASSYTFSNIEASHNITATFTSTSTATPTPTSSPTTAPTPTTTPNPTSTPTSTLTPTGVPTSTATHNELVSIVNVTDVAGETIAPTTNATGGFITQSVIRYSSTGDPIVNATATPNQGYKFAHWVLDGNDVTNTSITINMNQTHTLQAVFQANSEVTPTPVLATMGQYLPIIAAAIILGAVIFGVFIRRRKQSNTTVLN